MEKLCMNCKYCELFHKNQKGQSFYYCNNRKSHYFCYVVAYCRVNCEMYEKVKENGELRER